MATGCVLPLESVDWKEINSEPPPGSRRVMETDAPSSGKLAVEV